MVYPEYRRADCSNMQDSQYHYKEEISYWEIERVGRNTHRLEPA